MYVMHKPSYKFYSKPLETIQEETVTVSKKGRHYKVSKKSKGIKKYISFQTFKLKMNSRALSSGVVKKILSDHSPSSSVPRSVKAKSVDKLLADSPPAKKLKLDPAPIRYAVAYSDPKQAKFIDSDTTKSTEPLLESCT